MKHSTYTSYDELPLMLSVAEVASVLGISRAGAYELARSNRPRAQNWQPDRCSEGQVPRMDRRKQRFQKRTAVTKEELPYTAATTHTTNKITTDLSTFFLYDFRRSDDKPHSSPVHNAQEPVGG